MSSLPAKTYLVDEPMRTRRTPRCVACNYPLAICFCDEMPRIVARTRLVVVMHWIEATKSSNTGRLAARALVGAEVRVRGHRDAPRIEHDPTRRRLVLFPDPTARELVAADAGPDLDLIVPDGTWPQARKAAQRDDAARDAERVRLPEGLVSRYGLRRTRRPNVVSTFEAISCAYGILEGPSVEEPLAALYRSFIDAAERFRATGRDRRDV